MNPRIAAEPMVRVETCRLCGAERGVRLFEDPPFSVVRCKACSFVWVTPRLPDSQLEAVYGEDYWRSDMPREQGYADYVRDEPLYLKTFRRRLRLVARWAPAGGRILDVGCAAGFFLRTAMQAGYDVQGIELSPAIARHASQRLGADRVFVGRIEDVPRDHDRIRPGVFDVVTMWDVVEHVVDPHSLLLAARRFLRPDGVLILETQNVDSTFARLLGRRWQHFKHREHLYHFNPATIARLLEDTGFTVQRNSPAYGGKYVSFSFIAERAQRLGRLAGVLFRPLGLLGGANVYLNFRDEMVVVAVPSGRG